MGNKKSLICCSTNDKTTDIEQTSAHSKNPLVHRQTNTQTVQNVLLVWLDRNIVEHSLIDHNTITQLERVVNDINTFADMEECIQFIENIIDNKICIISSGSLGKHLVPCIHNMFQVDSIFIFSSDKKYHEQWAKEWPKIKGVFTKISSICEAFKQLAHQCEQDAIPISFVTTNDNVSEKNLNEFDPTFIYSQILKEILLTIRFDEEDIKKYIDYCRVVFAENDEKLKNVNQLQKHYHNKTPIWWYTGDYFLYPMLNRALRLMDIDIIIKMSFFISDLHFHIERLHFEQFSGDSSNQIFTVYRGQSMPKTSFDQMTKIQDGLISFNNFLLTSKDRNVSLDFARHALPNTDMVGILFVIHIDPSKSTTPFASIANVSYYQDKKDEVLFSIHTVFRIDDIKTMNENPRLFQVNLTLTSDNDKDLHVLTDRIQEETFLHEKGWQRLGLLLNKMAQSDRAQKVFEILLEQTTDDIEKGRVYEQLGLAKYNQGDYQEALVFYEKSLQIRQKSLPANHPDLATSYRNIGNAYREMGEYEKAFSSYEKSFEIQVQFLPPNHPDLGIAYSSFGLMRFNRGEYSKAYSFYEHAVNVVEHSYPPNHPFLKLCRKNRDDTKKKLT